MRTKTLAGRLKPDGCEVLTMSPGLLSSPGKWKK
jgi:hypothetical protein